MTIAATCVTPGCEREAGSNGYGKCCITCVEGELNGVHLAWCRRRNGDPDPTYGRIDPDIQQAVEAMEPASLGERVAMENTLQHRRLSQDMPDGGWAL